MFNRTALGPILDARQSQRKFEDPSKYKLSLAKKVEIQQNQIIDIKKIMHRVDYFVFNKKKFSEKFNQRVTISHLSANRFNPVRYQTPFVTIATLNKAYTNLLSKLHKYTESS